MLSLTFALLILGSSVATPLPERVTTYDDHLPSDPAFTLPLGAANQQSRGLSFGKSKDKYIPIHSWDDGNGDFTYLATVEVGGKSFEVEVDTGHWDSFLYSDKCKDPLCKDTKVKYKSKSGQAGTITFSGGNQKASGSWVSDKFKFGGQSIEQTFLCADEGQVPLPKDVTGLMGFGWPNVNQPKNQRPLWYQTGQSMFSIYFGDSSNAGQLTLGGYNPNCMATDIANVLFADVEQKALTDVEQEAFADVGKRSFLKDLVKVGKQKAPVDQKMPPIDQKMPIDWSIPLDRIGPYRPMSPPVWAVIDTGTTGVTGPFNEVVGVYHVNFPTARLVVQTPNNRSQEDQYIYVLDNLDSLGDLDRLITSKFGEAVMELPVRAFWTLRKDAKGNEYYHGLIEGSNMVEIWLVGNQVLKHFYTIYKASPPQIGFAPLATNNICKVP